MGLIQLGHQIRNIRNRSFSLKELKMGKTGKRLLNPTDAFRKAERDKEKKRVSNFIGINSEEFRRYTTLYECYMLHMYHLG